MTFCGIFTEAYESYCEDCLKGLKLRLAEDTLWLPNQLQLVVIGYAMPSRDDFSAVVFSTEINNTQWSIRFMPIVRSLVLTNNDGQDKRYVVVTTEELDDLPALARRINQGGFLRNLLSIVLANTIRARFASQKQGW